MADEERAGAKRQSKIPDDCHTCEKAKGETAVMSKERIKKEML